MRTRMMRKPAAVAASLALFFAVSACDADDPGTTTDPLDGTTTTFVGDVTTTTLGDIATTTTAAG